MKFLYIGLALLLACLVFCISTTVALDHYTSQASQQLETALELSQAGDLSTALKLVAEAQALWDRHHGFWGVILRHAEADEINAVFQELVAYARNNCKEEFEPTCANLIERIHHLSDMEKPYYYNIFTGCPCISQK